METESNNKESWKKRILQDLKEIAEELEKETDLDYEFILDLSDRVDNCIWWRY